MTKASLSKEWVRGFAKLKTSSRLNYNLCLKFDNDMVGIQVNLWIVESFDYVLPFAVLYNFWLNANLSCVMAILDQRA